MSDRCAPRSGTPRWHIRPTNGRGHSWRSGRWVGAREWPDGLALHRASHWSALHMARMGHGRGGGVAFRIGPDCLIGHRMAPAVSSRFVANPADRNGSLRATNEAPAAARRFVASAGESKRPVPKRLHAEMMVVALIVGSVSEYVW
jgi:hypothetical protein